MKKLSKGCVFFNFGTKCINNLLVAVYSLRLHYSGEVTVLLDNAPYREKLERDLAPLNLNFKTFHLGDNTYSSLRTLVFDQSPYATTLAFDSDLLFQASPEPLFAPTEQHGLLVTRFYPNPYGAYGRPEKQEFGSRLRRIESINHLFTPEEIEKARKRLLLDRIDVNVGVMGLSQPKGLPFFEEYSRLIEKGRGIELIDESLANLLIARYPHYLAEEEWNCPADNIFRKTALSEAKIIHYFADGYEPFGKRLGRNRATEAGQIWFKTFKEMHQTLPVAYWQKFDTLPHSGVGRVKYFAKRFSGKVARRLSSFKKAS